MRVAVIVVVKIGVTFALATLPLGWGLVAGILTLVVAWARKRTKNHSWGEVVGAWAVTLGVSLLIFAVIVRRQPW